jgi:hypothetical protein
MPGTADKFTQSAQGRLLWPGMTSGFIGVRRAGWTPGTFPFSEKCLEQINRRRGVFR